LTVIPQQFSVGVDMLPVEVDITPVFAVLRRCLENDKDPALPVAKGRRVLV
jgi:hypothetical protein